MSAAPSVWARFVVLGAHAVLMVGLPLAGGLLGVVAAAPLLLPLRGLWSGRSYTYAWTSLLIAFYLGACLMEAFAQPERRSAALGLAAIAAAEFCALLSFVRWRAVERRRGR